MIASRVRLGRPREWHDAEGRLRFHYDKCLHVHNGWVWTATNWADHRIKTPVAVTHEPNCYLRLGDLPVNGRSLNHRTNEFEAGVSVFHAIRFRSDLVLPWLDADQASKPGAFDAMDRPAFLVAGERLAECGSDGEPLLRDPAIVHAVRPVLIGDAALAWSVA